MSGTDTSFDHTALDDLLHSRIRLAVMALLASVDQAEFSFLKQQVKATDGNLGAHLRKLEDANYLVVSKQFIERKPQTRYALSPTGREALAVYLQKLETLLDGVRLQHDTEE